MVDAQGRSCTVIVGRVKIEAAMLAIAGKPFKMVYYPCASTSEFCVKVALVKQALAQAWCGTCDSKWPLRLKIFPE
jgi:hypothetical protein